jgi:hypothetical protein
LTASPLNSKLEDFQMAFRQVTDLENNKVYVNPDAVSSVEEIVEGTGDQARLVTLITFTNGTTFSTLTPARDVVSSFATL